MQILTKPQKLWIKALRSGKYKQGKSRLQYHNTFCCLGVACLVYEQETGNTLERSSLPYGDELYGQNLNRYRVVKQWLNLRSTLGRALKGDDKSLIDNKSLIQLNDTDNSFTDIANILEKQPELYFIQENDEKN